MKTKKIKPVKPNTITFSQMLFILFLGLKLTGNIDWNWFIVFTPIILNVIFRSIEYILISYNDKTDSEKQQEIIDIINKITTSNTEDENNILREKVSIKLKKYFS